ncbi:DUF6470 family protein [Paenibacillus tepidiphilus]|uniref:DUF6470 family protein n=1 Tax=Paenibacillus tepidiphilus TaxID=2608683 RepID=UPI00123BA37A|nr:DUF6470 family protein [Paenibacillus tepidiphilus]
MKVEVQYSQTRALIGIDTTPGKLEMSQPKADLQITTTPGKWNIHQAPAEVIIDQSKARAVYTGGTYPEMSQRIYSGVEQMWLQAIAKRMEQGERMANFHKPGNTIAEVYGTDWQPVSYPEIRETPSYDNVDIHVTPSPVQMEYTKGEVHFQAESHLPEYRYSPASVEIYMRQKPSLSFTPQVIDTQV